MANDKFYGYSPKSKKGSVGTPYGNDNRLDRVNPYEFRKGMDFELSTIGISRLQESTPEQRQQSTEKVLKNLGVHPSYYSCRIQFESEYRNHDGRKPSFKKYLKEKEEYKMKPVEQEYKNDKMVALKEAIKNEIRSILSEKNATDLGTGMYIDDDEWEIEMGRDPKAKDNAIKKSTGKEDDVDEGYNKPADRRLGAKTGFGAGDGGGGDDPDDDTVDKKATKKAKKAAKGVKGIEKEIAAKKDEKKSLKAKIDPLIAKFKSKELDKEAYLKKVGDAPKRIKAINDEVAKLEKALDAALVKETDDMREVAATAMDRDVNRKLLEIIKEAGAPLHEGAAGVKMHYDIARKAYMEGLTAGLNKD